MGRMADVSILLLSGQVGSGKTTVAQRVADLARRRGLACGGLLAPALRDGHGQKAGVWGVDLVTGERRILARTDLDLDGPYAGSYSFDARALAWAAGVLERDLASDLLFVDEIGWLELWQAEGLAPILPRLAAGEARRALVVVRDMLLAELLRRLRPAQAAVFCVSEQNREGLPEQIVARLAANGGWRMAGSRRQVVDGRRPVVDGLRRLADDDAGAKNEADLGQGAEALP